MIAATIKAAVRFAVTNEKLRNSLGGSIGSAT